MADWANCPAVESNPKKMGIIYLCTKHPDLPLIRAPLCGTLIP